LLPGFELHVAGKETEEVLHLKELAEKLDVRDRVFFHGYISDIRLFIKRIDFFVIASRSEGFPLSLQEIACMKKPVACSDIPLFREIFTEGEVAFFEPENPESLSRSITKLCNHGNEYAQKAYIRYSSSYTSEKMAENYECLYEKLIAKKVKHD
jgi:glycosyltransferase involved in cell wall biosynthesis